MVRKFDEPVLQEVLILMDCSRPPGPGHSEAEADLRDALLADLLFAAREQDGFFTLFLTDGESLSARPLDLTYRGKKTGAPRLILLTPDGRKRGLSAARLDGFAPPEELSEE